MKRSNLSQCHVVTLKTPVHESTIKEAIILDMKTNLVDDQNKSNKIGNTK